MSADDGGDGPPDWELHAGGCVCDAGVARFESYTVVTARYYRDLVHPWAQLDTPLASLLRRGVAWIEVAPTAGAGAIGLHISPPADPAGGLGARGLGFYSEAGAVSREGACCRLTAGWPGRLAPGELVRIALDAATRLVCVVRGGATFPLFMLPEEYDLGAVLFGVSGPRGAAVRLLATSAGACVRWRVRTIG